MAISSTAITDLPSLKRYLRITNTSDDRLLVELLDAATSRIQEFTQRTFVSNDFIEFQDGSGSSSLYLDNYPVTAVRRLGWNRKNALLVTANVASDMRDTVEVQDDKMIFKRWNSIGTEIILELTFAANKTTTLMATAITALTGWEATADEAVLCDELLRQGGTDATSGAQFYYIDSTDADYRVDEKTGRIDLLSSPSDTAWYPYDPNAGAFPRGSRNVYVDYTAGYAQDSVPDALQEIAWELCASAYHGGQHDPTIASESLDGYSYSTRNAMELRDDQMRRMDIWRRGAE
tara:strand:+ start:1185 stop:2057 length:873 start_codon:yes stop_codon:yes gene_type:complete